MTGLSGQDLYDFVALRRTNGGGVARFGDTYLEYGHPVPNYVSAALPRLVDSGMVELAPPDETGSRRATLTSAGRIRFDELCKRVD